MASVITDEKLNLINARRSAAGRPILGKADAIYLMERRRSAVRAQTGRDERSDHLLHFLINYSWMEEKKEPEAGSAPSADGFSPFPASKTSASSDSGGSSGGDSSGGGE